jgi:hypothetical protein
VFVVPDCHSRIKVLHCPVEVLLCGRGDDVVMVGHENEVMNEKVIFFMGFLQRLEDYAYDLALVEPEGPVVGPCDKMIGVDLLDDAQWPSHEKSVATSLPKCSDTGDKGLDLLPPH